tara:strand:- start:1113 stop:1280 length:168 start_codon:yes stop_codon:yes gene_type:complete
MNDYDNLQFELLKEMVKCGFCGEFQQTLELAGIDYTKQWSTEDLDGWFNSGLRFK